MSEPKYIQELREQMMVMSITELFHNYVNEWGQPDDYDGGFTTRGLNIATASERYITTALAAAEQRVGELKTYAQLLEGGHAEKAVDFRRALGIDEEMARWVIPDEHRATLNRLGE